MSEIIVGLLLGRQLTTSPDIVGLAPSEGKDVITSNQLVGKFSNASCGGQKKIITFQEPPAGQYMMKSSRVIAIVGMPKIEIDNPIVNEKVGLKYVFRGKSCGIAKSDLKIYVLIHPLETDRWWVQYPTIIDSNGEWSARGQFAETAGQAVEEEFEVIAIATISELKIGQKSVEIPRHIVHSKIVTTLKTRL